MPEPRTYCNGYRFFTLTVPGAICSATSDFDIQINVIRYSNTGSSGTKRQNVAGLDDGQKDMVQRFYHRYLDDLKKGSEPFPDTMLAPGFSIHTTNNVYMGKGSPKAIASTLLLFGAYEEKGAIKQRKWASEGLLERALNDHCSGVGNNGRIGVDCLGFAANFWIDTKKLSTKQEFVGGLDMEFFTGWSKGSIKLRSRLGDVRAKDALVYLHGGDLKQKARHIAIIDRIYSTGDELSLLIAESYGGVGPQADVTIGLFDEKEEGNLGKCFTLSRSGARSKVYAVPYDP